MNDLIIHSGKKLNFCPILTGDFTVCFIEWKKDKCNKQTQPLTGYFTFNIAYLKSSIHTFPCVCFFHFGVFVIFCIHAFNHQWNKENTQKWRKVNSLFPLFHDSESMCQCIQGWKYSQGHWYFSQRKWQHPLQVLCPLYLVAVCACSKAKQTKHDEGKRVQLVRLF